MRFILIIFLFASIMTRGTSQGEIVTSCPANYDHILCENWLKNKFLVSDILCTIGGSTIEYEIGYYISPSFPDKVFYYEKLFCCDTEGIDPCQYIYYDCTGNEVEAYSPETFGPWAGPAYLETEYFPEFGSNMFGINFPEDDMIEMFDEATGSFPNCDNVDISDSRDFCLINPNYIVTQDISYICGVDGNIYENSSIASNCYGINSATDPMDCNFICNNGSVEAGEEEDGCGGDFCPSCSSQVGCGLMTDEIICQDFIQDALFDYSWESNCAISGCSYTISVGKYLGNDVVIMREECFAGMEFGYYWRIYTCEGILLEECSIGLTGTCEEGNTVYDNVTGFEIIYDCLEQELPANCECVISSMACNDMVEVIMTTETSSVSVFDVLEGENTNCTYSFSSTQTIEQLFFDCNDIGSQEYQVFDLTNGNTCWGTLNIINDGGCDDVFVCPSDPDTILCQTWLSNIVNSSICNFSNPQNYNYFKVYTVPYQGDTAILYYKEQFVISDGVNEFTLYSCAGDTLYECFQGLAGDCNNLNADPVFGPIINDTVLIYDCRVDQLDCPNTGQIPFVTTWQTDNPGTSCSSCITIPTSLGETYNYDVDWDNDGVYDEFGITGDVTHDFGISGTYYVVLKGDFPRIYFNDEGDKEKIINIDQWGDIEWVSMEHAFTGCAYIQSGAPDAPDLRIVTDMSFMFAGAENFNYNLSNWDVSNVTYMTGIFQSATTFNGDISQWEVSNVINMRGMFNSARSFNQDISSWDVSNVTDMSFLFGVASNFNQDISSWNVSNATNMSQMFRSADNFNQDVSLWDVSNVTDMSFMFWSAEIFNQDISSWNVSNVTDMSFMFLGAENFNQDISSWDVSNVTDMSWMLRSASNFNQDISSWDVSSVTDMSGMIKEAVSFNQSLETWDIGALIEFTEMLDDSGIDCDNYSSTLIGWVDNINTPNNLTLGASSMEYGANATSARNQLLVKGWTINGDLQGSCGVSLECSSSVDSILCFDWLNQIISNTDFCIDPGPSAITYKVYTTTHNGAPAILIDESINCINPTAFGAGFTLYECDGNQIESCSYQGVETCSNPPDDNPIIGPAYNIATLIYDSEIDVMPDCDTQRPFITTWKTDNPGTSCSTCITIPTLGSGYNYDVDWDNDGVFDEFGITGDVSHDFIISGTYTIRLRGEFPWIYFNDQEDKDKIINIDQWGDIEWTSMSSAFVGCENLLSDALDSPNLNNVTSLHSMFRKATQFNTNISDWDVSNITDMNWMFALATSFNQDISNWNVSNVEDMRYMFFGADNFNQDISKWNVCNVENMSSMFGQTDNFNQDIGDWDLKSISGMFDMLDVSGVDCENYTSTLIGWAANSNIPNDVTFGALSMEYDISAASARDQLIAKGWTIIGDSQGSCPNTTNPFITTWKTDNPGTSCSSCITIPTVSGETYSYDVDWDNDGTYDEFGLTNDATYDFPSAGTYTVAIRGVFPRIYFNNNGDRQKIINIDQWGDIEWSSMESAFMGCENLNSNASDAPDLSSVTNMLNMFRSASSFNHSLDNWDVSNVTSMSFMFAWASSFDQPLNNWNVSNVSTMNNMFQNATSFNQPLSNWDVSNVDDMSLMFSNAESFNQSIESWIVQNVSDMGYMFRGATAFNQNLASLDLSSISEVESMLDNSGIDCENYSFTLIGWAANNNTPNNLNLGAQGLEYGGTAIAARDQLITKGWTINGDSQGDCLNDQRPFITTWKTDNSGTSCSSCITIPTFPGETYNYDVDWDNDGTYDEFGVSGDATHDFTTSGTYTIAIKGEFPRIYFNSEGDEEKIVNINQWGDIDWKSMSSAFHGCQNLNSNAIDAPDLKNVNDFRSMFQFAQSFNHNIGDWDVSNVTDMSSMFTTAVSFNQDISAWSVSNVTSMSNMFSLADSFNQDISSWDVSNVVNMNRMFNRTDNFDQNISSWDVSNVTNASSMFRFAISFNQSLAVWEFNTSADLVLLFDNSGIDCSNYTFTLQGWAANTNTPSNLEFGAQNVEYGNEAINARDSLINILGWTISGDIDLGKDCVECGPGSCLADNPPDWIDTQSLADITVSCVSDIPILLLLEYSNGQSADCLIEGSIVPNRDETNFDGCSGTIDDVWNYTTTCGDAIASYSRTITVSNQGTLVFDNTPEPSISINCDEIDLYDISLDYMVDQGNNCISGGTVDPVITNNYDACGGTITLTWSVDEPCYGLLEYTQTANILPNDNYQFSDLPKDLILDCDALPFTPEVLTISNGIEGACAASEQVVATTNPQSQDCPGTITNTWVFVNPCNGSPITHVQTITLVDCAPATLKEDNIEVRAGNTYNINLFDNDILPDTFTVSITEIEREDIFFSSIFTDDGNFEFALEKSFFDTIRISYEVCNIKCDNCTTGILKIVDEALKDIFLTDIITPDGDGTNDVLRFNFESEIKGLQIIIFNRWGNKIYESINYENDWDASGFPGGIYFYVLRLGESEIKKTLTIVK